MGKILQDEYISVMRIYFCYEKIFLYRDKYFRTGKVVLYWKNIFVLR